MSETILCSSKSNYVDVRPENVYISGELLYQHENVPIESSEENKINEESEENEIFLGNGGFGNVYKSKMNIEIAKKKNENGRQ